MINFSSSNFNIITNTNRIAKIVEDVAENMETNIMKI